MKAKRQGWNCIRLSMSVTGHQQLYLSSISFEEGRTNLKLSLGNDQIYYL